MKAFCRSLRTLGVLALFLVSGLARGQEISLTLRSVPVSKAITEIQKASGYSIVVKSDDLDMSATVSLSIENESVESAISKVFAPQPVDISVSGKNISISRRQPLPAAPVAGAQTVRGVVRDENGEPLMSAAVQVKGKGGQGVITGLDGDYEIAAGPSGQCSPRSPCIPSVHPLPASLSASLSASPLRPLCVPSVRPLPVLPRRKPGRISCRREPTAAKGAGTRNGR